MNARPRHTDDGPIMVTVPIPRDVLTLVAPPPDTLSQKNVLAATGIPPRTFLELLRAPDFEIPITSIGKLRIVDRVRFVTWLTARANAPPPARGRPMLPTLSRPSWA
jgi:hypothetical protein